VTNERLGFRAWGYDSAQMRYRYWHFGEQTAWDLPTSLRVIISDRGRCFPHKKHDMVDLPGSDEVTKGDPPTFDL
jgi:hypothetical protein